MTPSHAPIPAIEFERAELLAAEKESIGLFISAHPLKEVGPALRARVDCPLAELAGRRDGDWVTVGGMITETKRIRTKKGDPMMFATLDDLEASVELLVFGNALAAAGDAARARLDRARPRPGRPQGSRHDVPRSSSRSSASSRAPEEVAEAREEAARRPVLPSALRLRLDATALAASVLAELKDVLAGFPGESRGGDRAEHLGRPAAAQARSGLPRRPQRGAARRAR